MNAGRIEIEVDTSRATKNVHELRAAMAALKKDTNRTPVTRLEWFAVAFIVSQTIGNVGILLIAIALLRGHP